MKNAIFLYFLFSSAVLHLRGMKTVIIYESKYGSTEKYAKDIGTRVGADVLPFKKFKWKTLNEYDIVVFGSYIRGGAITKINDFLQHWDETEGKAVIVFGVGMALPTKESRDQLISSNVLYDLHLRFYQFQGNFDFSKLKFPDNFMFNQSIKLMKARPELGGAPEQLDWIKENPVNVYDQEKVDRVVSVIEKIKIGEASK